MMFFLRPGAGAGAGAVPIPSLGKESFKDSLRTGPWAHFTLGHRPGASEKIA